MRANRLSPVLSFAASIFIGLALAAGLFASLRAPAAFAETDDLACFVEATGDDVADFSSEDASALQAAVDAASDGALLKVAGTCTGVTATAGLSQTVYISKSLMLQGGYAVDDWTVSDPVANPTTLDANQQSRVAVVTGTIHVTLDGLVLTGGQSQAGPLGRDGAGIWTNSHLTLTNSSLVSNTISGGSPGDNGAGLHMLNGTLYVADSTIAHNRNATSANVWGGGLYLEDSTATLLRTVVQDNGMARGGRGGGLAVWSGTHLTIQDSQLLDNFTRGNADSGGGAFLRGATSVITVTNSLVAGNMTHNAGASGAGIYALNASLIIEDSVIRDNHTSGFLSHGAGVALVSASASIANTSFLSNTTALATGAALYHSGEGVRLDVRDSTVAYNQSLSASHPGGGFALSDTGGPNIHTTLDNVTFSGNTSGGQAGAMWVPRGYVTMTHVTLNDNSAVAATGGISVGVQGSVYMANSLIANSTGGDCASAGAFTDGGYNLVEDGSCLTDATSQSGDPLLSPLSYVGGDTGVHFLLSGSPALHAIPEGVSGCGTTHTADQHGRTRPGGAGCDLGAVEFEAACFIETSGDNDFDYVSGDNTALQTAVDAASDGALLKVAGTCAGVTATGGLSQTVYISKSLTLQGGFALDDWSVSDPDANPTTLDANQLGGRVARIIGDSIDVTLDGLVLTGGYGSSGSLNAGGGAGIWSNSRLTLTHVSLVSNTIPAPSSGYDGAGLFATGGTLYVADSTIAHNENADDEGGGLLLSDLQAAFVRSVIEDNRAVGTGNSGGGLVVRGGAHVTIDDSQILNNYTTGNVAGGGAGDLQGATTFVTVTNSTLAGNALHGDFSSGAVFYASGTNLAIVDSVIQDNHTYGADGYGAGLRLLNTRASLAGTSLLSNTTASGSGAGIFVEGDLNANLSLRDSTVAYNQSLGAGHHGAGLAISPLEFTTAGVALENVTFSGNIAAGEGGALWVPRAYLTMTHVTLSDNTAIGATGGISVGVEGSVYMANSLIANSTGGDCASAGAFTDAGYNLVEDGSCITGATSLSGDPALGPLADNGGSTLTHALLSGSPAVDAIPEGMSGCGTTYTADQRGETRPQGAGCDMGAFELTFVPPACQVETTGDDTADFTSDDASALQAAVDAASDGDLLKVAGICAGVSAAGGLTQTVYIDTPLTLRGGYTITNWTVSDPDANPTVLDAQQQGRVVYAAAPLTLENLTVTGGYYSNGSVGGGGLYSAEPITLTGLIFSGNTITGTTGVRTGGGAHLAGTAVISGSTFVGNTSYSRGGALFVAGAGSVITNTVFEANLTTNSDGGGLAVTGELVAVSGATFYANQARGWGGGAFWVAGSGWVENSSFVSNIGTERAGGAYFQYVAVILNTTFMSNTTVFEAGGGAYLNSGGYIVDSIFTGNTATSAGGGAYSGSSLIVGGSTFTANTAGLGGGGLFAQGFSVITDTTFVANVANAVGGGLRVSGNDTQASGLYFYGNHGQNNGGAVYWSGSGGYFENSSVVSNTTGGSGGGLYFANDIKLSNVTVMSNTASGSGGGAYLAARATVAGSAFTANTAGANGGGAAFNHQTSVERTLFAGNRAVYGGGAYSAGTIAAGALRAFTNTVFAGNTALDEDGAALYHTGTNALRLTHATIASPTLGSGTAIFILQNAPVALTNNLIANYATGIQSVGGVVTEDYTLFSGVTEPYVNVTPGAHAFTGTAGFVDAAAGDYRLAAGSDAVNAGTDAGVAADYDGTTRPQDYFFDIGAFERVIGSYCAVEANGDDVTDYLSEDASALQAAVDAASAGDVLKVAGTCLGVNVTDAMSQTVYITKSLTLQGGYHPSDWTVPDPEAYPTTLDANQQGRVAVVTGDIDVTLDRLVLTGGQVLTNALVGSGAGLYTTSRVTLTHSSLVSNTIAIALGEDGAGLYSEGAALYIADSVIAHNENAVDDGGGLYLIATQATIVRSVIEDNRTLGTGNSGGGLVLRGGSHVTIDDSQILNNYTTGSSASGGAGRLESTNVLTVTNSLLAGNAVYGNGSYGAVFYTSEATVTFLNSVIQDNHIYGSGGSGAGIHMGGSRVTVVGSSILSNTTANATGAGIYLSGGALDMRDSTVAYNQALGDGQSGGGLGINPFGGNDKHIMLENVTFSGNSASGEGGGLWVSSGYLTMTHVTLSDNAAQGGAGGLSIGADGSAYVANSLIANSTGADCASLGTFTDAGYNLVEDGACLTAATSQAGDPALGPLADNGGSTLTHALLAGSPAVDAVPPGANGCNTAPQTDQRGEPRPQGLGCDTGAFEVAVAAACFVEATGDNITDYASADAEAVQAAVNAASAGDVLKVAGTCAGVNVTNDLTQTLYIDKPLTMQGGYAVGDWTVSDPDLNPTTLDAQRLGRVAVVTGTIDVTLDGLVLTGGYNDEDSLNGGGAGLWSNSRLTLTHSSVISNLIPTALVGLHGGGVHFEGGRLYVADSTITDNEAGSGSGGGLFLQDSQAAIVRSVIQNNRSLSTQVGGGGVLVWHRTTLTIADSQILDNYTIGEVAFGGGVHVSGPSTVVTVTNSRLAGNATYGELASGGGLISQLAPVTVQNSVVEDNHTHGSDAHGGGLVVFLGSLTLENSSVLSNTTNGRGGGVAAGVDSAVAMRNSTIAYNQALDAASAGGGLFFTSTDQHAVVENVTFSHNQSAGDGAAVFVESGPLTMTHVTLSDNTAQGGAGGLSIGADGSVYLASSLIANSTGADCANAGAFTDLGYNLVEDGTCITGASSLSGDPNLGPLADNGGDTLTHALLAGSPALGLVPPSSNGCGTTVTADQRGQPRPNGAGCDAGAYEYQGGGITIRLQATPAEGQDFDFTSTLGAFSLDDAETGDGDNLGDSVDFTELFPGVYVFTQTLPPGWTLDSVTCDGGNWAAGPDANSLTVTLAGTEVVTCTFTNSQDDDDDGGGNEGGTGYALFLPFINRAEP